jgi:cation transport regulator
MPYKLDNPPDRIKGLPKHAQEIWIKAFNNALKQYNGDEGKANATAWSAIEKAGYHKNKSGQWVKGESCITQFLTELKNNTKKVWKSKDSESDKHDIVTQAVQSSTVFGPTYSITAIFSDVVILSDNEKGEFYAVEYEIEKDNVILGNKQKVDIAYIPEDVVKDSKKLKKFIEALKANPDKVWKTAQSEYDKRTMLNQAIYNSPMFGDKIDVVAIFPDVVIVQTLDDKKYFAVTYALQGDKVTLGEYTEVDIAYVPKGAPSAAPNKRPGSAPVLPGGDDGNGGNGLVPGIKVPISPSVPSTPTTPRGGSLSGGGGTLGSAHKKNGEIVDSYYHSCTLEESEKGESFLNGVFVEADTRNLNNRIYPSNIVDRVIEHVNNNTVMGLDGHPVTDGTYREVALRFMSAWRDGNMGHVKAKILDTIAGQNLKIIAKEGVPIGLSMRGYGDEKYEKDKKAKIVQENYVLSGIDAVLEPAFAKAKAIQEQKQKEENVDELKQQIESLQTQLKELTEKITATDDEDKKVLTELKAERDKLKALSEAKTRVKELLESDELKDFEFKDVLKNHLEKCETVDEVNKAYPRVMETLKEFKGQTSKPEPTSLIITEHGFFGDKKVPNTIHEAYQWMLDKFENKPMADPRDNPRWVAKRLIDNYIKYYLADENMERLDAGYIPDSDVLVNSRRNPLYHLTRKAMQETLGDTEAYTTDVKATAAYILPIYTYVMKDLMDIVNQVCATQPLDRPTGKAFFQKEYYGDGAGTWSEVSDNFSKTQGQKTEGNTPLIMKTTLASTDISLQTSLRIYAPWTIDLEQDMKAYHGLNVDSVFSQMMRKEIFREISHQVLYIMLTGTAIASGDGLVQASGSPTTFSLTPDADWTGGEWITKGFTRAVKQASALLDKDPYNVVPDCIIADSALAYLFTEPHFVADDSGKTPGNFGFRKVGTFMSEYKVFLTSMSDFANKILLSYRGSSFSDASTIFLPYILFYLGPRIDTSTLKASRSCLSRFGIEKAAGKKIAIINVTA